MILLKKCILSLFVFNYFTLFASADQWIAPDSAKTMKSTIADTPENIAAGKAVYAKRCSSCHGDSGAGDGEDAADLSKEPAKLYADEIKQQLDGELFWKIRTGRKPMPKYDTRISEEETWKVVKYIKTLEKK